MESKELKQYGNRLKDSKFHLGQLVYFIDNTPAFGIKDLQVIGVVTKISRNKWEDKDNYTYEVQSNMGHYFLCLEEVLNPIDDSTKIKIG